MLICRPYLHKLLNVKNVLLVWHNFDCWDPLLVGWEMLKFLVLLKAKSKIIKKIFSPKAANEKDRKFGALKLKLVLKFFEAVLPRYSCLVKLELKGLQC